MPGWAREAINHSKGIRITRDERAKRGGRGEGVEGRGLFL